MFVDWEIKEIEVKHPKSPLTILQHSEGIALNFMYIRIRKSLTKTNLRLQFLCKINEDKNV